MVRTHLYNEILASHGAWHYHTWRPWLEGVTWPRYPGWRWYHWWVRGGQVGYNLVAGPLRIDVEIVWTVYPCLSKSSPLPQVKLDPKQFWSSLYTVSWVSCMCIRIAGLRWINLITPTHMQWTLNNEISLCSNKLKSTVFSTLVPDQKQIATFLARHPRMYWGCYIFKVEVSLPTQRGRGNLTITVLLPYELLSILSHLWSATTQLSSTQPIRFMPLQNNCCVCNCTKLQTPNPPLSRESGTRLGRSQYQEISSYILQGIFTSWIILLQLIF